MAIKKIKLPDGSIKQFKVPDDWSNDQIMEAAGNYFNLSKPEEKKDNTQGLSGILNDFVNAIKESPGNLAQMGMQLPSQALKGGSQLLSNQTSLFPVPIRPVLNFGAGALEGLKGILNIPYNVEQYLQKKGLADNSSTDDFLKKYGKMSQEDIDKFRKSQHIGDTGLQKLVLGEPQTGDEFWQGIGSFLPFSGIGAEAKGLEGILKRAGAASAYAVSQNQNPVTAALAAPIAEGLANTVKAGVKNATQLTPQNIVKKSVFQDVELTPEVQERLDAAKRQGINLTPAEAAGSEQAGAAQGQTGITNAGSKIVRDAAKQRKMQETNAISNFYNTISNTTKNAPQDVREALQNEKESLINQRKQEAEPWYKKSEMQKVPQNWIKNLKDNDPNINNAINDVLNDERYQKKGELLNVPENTIKVLDYAKRNLDSKIKAALSGDKTNNDLARILKGSRDDLVSKIDSINPNYKMSRQIYAEKSQPINMFDKSEVGRISDLNDLQLKNVSNQIFDPAQTDLSVLKNIKDTVRNQNPAAWDKIVRYQMEKLMGNKKDVNGMTFYNTIISNPQRFKQFEAALDHNPKALQQLQDLKLTFENIVPLSKTPRASAKLSATNISNARSLIDEFKKVLIKKFGQKYDESKAKLMTSPDWESKLKEFENSQKSKETGTIIPYDYLSRAYFASQNKNED